MQSAAIGIIFNMTKDQVLLIKRRDVPVWVLPGGGIESGENPSTAAIREIYEETGLHVTVKREIAEYTPINRLAALTYTFECAAASGTLQTGDETKEIAFFSLNNLPKELFVIHRDWLNDALLNEQSMIRKNIDNVTYRRLFLYLLKNPGQVIRFALSRLGFPMNKEE